jgi:hypothetical protein
MQLYMQINTRIMVALLLTKRIQVQHAQQVTGVGPAPFFQSHAHPNT